MIVETSGGKFENEVSFEQSLTFETAAGYFASKGVAWGPTQMKTLGLINQGKLYTNLALLLSDQCPYSVKAAVFQGNRKTIFRDRAEFSGSIFQQLEDAFAYVMRHNNLGSTYSGLHRIDTLDFPETAVREGLLNALIHRDYGSSGPIIVSIFDDRLEILNQGGLLPNMTVEEVLRGVSEQRNKKLAEIFYRLTLIEAYGTGYDKIDAAYEGFGKTGQISVTPNSFCLTLPNRNEAEAEAEVEVKPNEIITNILPPVSGRLEQIVALCQKKNSITRRDVQQALGISQTTALVLLNRMIENGILVKVQNGKFAWYKLAKPIAS